jgi:hypothetical protein
MIWAVVARRRKKRMNFKEGEIALSFLQISSVIFLSSLVFSESLGKMAMGMKKMAFSISSKMKSQMTSTLERNQVEDL